MNGAVPLSYAPPVEYDAVTITSREKGSLLGYGLLYLPFAIAWLVGGTPVLSYLVAWMGSFWILFLTLTGRVKPLPTDRSLFDQILRPVVLTHLIFAGYNFISSIFYFLDIHGFYYLWRDPFAVAPEELVVLTAEAQRYYVLAHAGVATGMLALMDYRRSGEWVIRPMGNPTAFLLIVSGVSFVLAQGLGGALGQIAGRFSQLGLVASVLALALAVPTGRLGLLVVSSVVFAVNAGGALMSGFKEDVLTMAILLAAFAYPYAKKTVIIGGPVVLVFLFAVLPTYANVFRSLSWAGTATEEEAAAAAIEAVRSGEQDMAWNNWQFLSGRISEINLFVGYMGSINMTGRFYGTQILEQTAESLVPRALWSDKPSTEDIVMERVYENGIVSRDAEVSAKPQYVVDGYLSFGGVGLWVAALVFGLLASLASRTSERFFGGYFWGSGLIYTSFFAGFWRGNAFEFFFNYVVWSAILLVPVFLIARMTGLLHRRSEFDIPTEGEGGPKVRFRDPAS